MYRRTLIAIAVGLLSYFVIRYASEVLDRHTSTSGLLSFWVVVSAFTSMLVTLLPGFIAGWISCNRGLLSGFVVGLVGSGCYSALAGTAAQYFSAGSNQAVLVTWFFAMCIVVGVFGAAAGGAAQLLRSNQSSEADGYAAAQLQR